MRSKRKTFSLCVDRNGEILVRAPLFASDEKIAELVKKHELWISRRLNDCRERKRLPLRNGDKIVLFGKEYIIQEGRTALSGGICFLPGKDRVAYFKRLLKERTKEYMAMLTRDIASRYAFSFRGVRASGARTRWGSCNRNGVISYSCYLAFTDFELCRYVAVHELCHTRVFSHSARFWREVERILPDWRELRAKLRQQEKVFAYLG